MPRHRLKERTETAVRPKEEVEAAIALFLYRRLQGVQPTNYLSPLVLAGLLSAGDEGIAKVDIASMPALKNFTKGGTNFEEAIRETMDNLIRQCLVSDVAEKFTITRSGREKSKEYQAIRNTEKDQAYGQFRLNRMMNSDRMTEVALISD